MSPHYLTLHNTSNTCLEAIGQFGIDIAHELASPLNAIAMNAETVHLSIERGQSAQAREVIEYIINDCKRCAQLLRGLQHFSSATLPYPWEVLMLREIVENAVFVTADNMNCHTDTIHVQPMDPTLQIMGSRPALEQSLTNILCNAVEANANEIHIRTTQQEETTTLEIRDNGSGISKEILSKIYNPFFSTHRSKGNIGLGLSLAQNVILHHGGQLTIGNNADKGAFVTIILPLQKTGFANIEN